MCTPRCVINLKHCIDGLVQERQNSSALAMELRLSCTHPSVCTELNWIQLNAYQRLGAELQYLQCISNGDTAVLH